MITVTRLNGGAFALNPDLIERVEATPDTVIVLVDSTRYVVRERVEEITYRVREAKAAIIALSHSLDHAAQLSEQGAPPTHPSNPAPVLRVVTDNGDK